MAAWGEHDKPLVYEPYNPADNVGRISMRDVRFRVRARAALDRLREHVEHTRGADLALAVAQLETLSPPPDSPEDAALKASNATRSAP